MGLVSINNLIQIFISKIFWSDIFLVAKSFPRKQVTTKNVHRKFFNFHKKILVENFLRSQIHFLENWLPPKIFINNFLVDNVLRLQIQFLENRFLPKIFIQNFLVNDFLWFPNHFLDIRFLPKIFIKNFC